MADADLSNWDASSEDEKPVRDPDWRNIKAAGIYPEKDASVKLLEEKFEKFEEKIRALQAYIQRLEDRIEHLEGWARDTDL